MIHPYIKVLVIFIILIIIGSIIYLLTKTEPEEIPEPEKILEPEKNITPKIYQNDSCDEHLEYIKKHIQERKKIEDEFKTFMETKVQPWKNRTGEYSKYAQHGKQLNFIVKYGGLHWDLNYSCRLCSGGTKPIYNGDYDPCPYKNCDEKHHGSYCFYTRDNSSWQNIPNDNDKYILYNADSFYAGADGRSQGHWQCLKPDQILTEEYNDYKRSKPQVPTNLKSHVRDLGEDGYELIQFNIPNLNVTCCKQLFNVIGNSNISDIQQKCGPS
jgi:hypothetical protein